MATLAVGPGQADTSIVAAVAASASGDTVGVLVAWSCDASGWQRGLNPDAWFNTQYHLSHNPDVRAAHLDPLLHYVRSGQAEGRATYSV